MKVLVGLLVGVAIAYLTGWGLVLGSEDNAIASVSPGFRDRITSAEKRDEIKERVEEWRKEQGLPKAALTDSRREELAIRRESFDVLMAKMYYEDAFKTVQAHGWTFRLNKVVAIRIFDKPWGFIQTWRFFGPVWQTFSFLGLGLTIYFPILGVVFQYQGKSVKDLFARW